MKKTLPFLLFAFFTLAFSVDAQDLANIGKTDPIKISGSVSANQIFYHSFGIDNRRPPYNYFLSGNLNINLYGLSIPLGFTYSNQQSQFQQPFNQFGIAPTYKWVKAYLGYNSLVYSPYTLNGHIFLGGGVELTPPGIFRCSAMYGRLLKAVEEDTSNRYSIPSYQRMGYGVKLGVGKDKDFIDFVLFHARDKETSIQTPLYNDVLPAENLVVGLVGNKVILKRINLSAEVANSALSRDVRNEEVQERGIYNAYGPLFTYRTSTASYNALKGNITYTGNIYAVGLGYERIDPGYQTLGSYFFNNDLRNITVNGSLRLLQGKLNMAANVGTQKNNLDDSKVSTMSRIVGAMNVNFTPTPKLNFNGSYSNFQTFTRIRSNFERINQLPFTQIDTLNFTQVTQSANVGTAYFLGNPASKELRQNVNLALTYQVAGDARGNQGINSGTRFYNANASYSWNKVPLNLTITTALNANYSEIAPFNSLMLGPTLSATKLFFDKKLRSNTSISWNKSFNNGAGQNRVLIVRLGGSYVVLKKHSLNASVVVMNRNTTQMNAKSFTEFTGTLGYAYSF